MRKKVLYYFLKYYHITTIKSVNKFNIDVNDIDINSSIPLALSDIDPMESYKILKNIPNTTNLHNFIPKNNSSIIDYSLLSDINNQPNQPFYGNNTDRINYRNILEKKNMRKRRTLSYGNLQVKMNKDNQNFSIIDSDNQNKSHIFNRTYILNNDTQSLKHIFPNYTYTTPNKYVFPINLNNNNNSINNNYFSHYPTNNVIYPNDLKGEQSKPLLWYTNVFPSISQVSIMQDNNYLNCFQNQTPKYINNSAYFNSITNINNSYSEDYLNKQIYDFINANSKTKKIIITNIGKKHNIKLNKSKKTNEKNIKNKEKEEKNKKDKNTFKNRNKQITFEKMKKINHSELHELNNESFQNEIIINKYKKNQKLKISKNSIPIGQKKKNVINDLKRNNINLDKNKIIKNYSIEISNSGQILNNNDYIYENNKSQYELSHNINNGQLNNDNINNIYNTDDKEEDEQNNSYNETLGMSLQSINDSKMLEMANYFIDDDKIVNKEKISEILNEKNSQRNFKIINKNYK